jgi:hypothetical protein
MARRYTRREFLVDASFMFGSSLLLKVFAPQATANSEEAHYAKTSEILRISEVSQPEQAS